MEQVGEAVASLHDSEEITAFRNACTYPSAGMYAQRMSPNVHMMLGLPGSGKTTLSVKLSEQLGLPRFSLDEEYFSVVPNNQQSERDFRVEAQVEERIKDRVSVLLANGTSVVLDFCPWRVAQRRSYYSFISSHGGIPQVHYLPVERDELIRRFEIRNLLKDERYQYMSAEMLDEFYTRFDEPVEEEAKYIVTPGNVIACASSRGVR